MIKEPGHPHGLNTLLITLAVFASSFSGRWSGAAVGGSLGAIAAAMLMVKINVGVFLTLAVALALTTSARGDRIARLAGLLASAVALFLPALLLRVHLGTSWGTAYCAVVTLSIVPLLVLAWEGPLRTEVGWRQRVYVWFTVALLFALGAIAGVTLGFGTSVAGLVRGVLIRPLGFGATYFVAVPFRTRAIAPAACSVALFFGFRHWESRGETARRRVGWAIDGLKLAYALFVLLFARRHEVVFLLNYALPWLWLVLVPSGRSSRSRDDFFPRLVLALVACLEALQAYPVPGSQMVLGTFLLIPVAALCTHDLVGGLRARRSASGGDLRRWRLASLVAPWMIVAVCAATACRAYQDHQSLVPLDLPGARRVRLPEQDVALYTWMAANLRAHSDSFITLPGYDSLYFWAEKEPPTALNTTLWWMLLDDREQEQIVEALSRCPRACVIGQYHPGWVAHTQVRGRSASTMPLVRYILDNFETIGRVNEYEFMVRRGRGKVELQQCVIEESRRSSGVVGAGSHSATGRRALTLVTTAMPGRTLRRVSAINRITQVDLCDTEERPGTCTFEVCDEWGRRLDLSSNQRAEVVDLSRPRRLTLLVPSRCDLGDLGLLVFRLFDADRRMLPPVALMREGPS